MIKVLTEDDSVFVRGLLKSKLSSYSCSDREVFGTVAEPFIAKDMIAKVEPGVVVLYVEMPNVDRITFCLDQCLSTLSE